MNISSISIHFLRMWMIFVTIIIISCYISPIKGNENVINSITPVKQHGSTLDVNEKPYTYVKVLVIAEEALSEKCGGFEIMKLYYQSFFKAVDKYVQLLKNPGVRIKIVGIKKLEIHPSESNKASLSNESWIGSVSALRYFNERLRMETVEIKDFPHYDIAFYMTEQNLCAKINDEDRSKCDYFETARFASLNADNIYRKQIPDGLVAIINDGELSFEGVWRAITIIGSLLGAPIDGSPDAKECNPQDGYFMTPEIKWENYKFEWSDCSIASIRNFLKNSIQSSYLERAMVKEKETFDNVQLPGHLVPIDLICYRRTGNHLGACYYDVDMCNSLVCKEENKDCRRKAIGQPAPEGSWCKDGSRCSRGECRKSEG